MQSFFFLSLLLFIVTFCFDSVISDCFLIRCKRGTVPVNGGCQAGRRVKRTYIRDEDCYGNDKIFVAGETFDQPGPTSIECPNGYVFNRQMQCQVEGWEPNSGPWETHHYVARGRRLVISVKRSDTSCRIRALSID